MACDCNTDPARGAARPTSAAAAAGAGLGEAGAFGQHLDGVSISEWCDLDSDWKPQHQHEHDGVRGTGGHLAHQLGTLDSHVHECNGAIALTSRMEPVATNFTKHERIRGIRGNSLGELYRRATKTLPCYAIQWVRKRPMKAIKSQLFRVCPKSGKIVGVRKPQGLMRVFLPVIGLLALAWFLLRVVPKPSRAAYPCQRVAMPLASGFVLWLAGIVGLTWPFAAPGCTSDSRAGSAERSLSVVGRRRPRLGHDEPAEAVPCAYTPHAANAPIGVAKGYKPGAVAWVHDPQITDWNGTAAVVSAELV